MPSALHGRAERAGQTAGESRYLVVLADHDTREQLMYLVVIQSLVTALVGSQKRWHVNRRFGTFSETPVGTTAGRGG